MSNLNQDSLVILMLCTNLGLNQNNDSAYVPYTLSKWNELADKIGRSSLKTPSSLLGVEPSTIKRELGLDDEEMQRISFLISRGVSLAVQLESLTSSGIKVTTRAEKNYPESLKKVLKRYSPPVLYYCGDLEISNRKGIAIVGSRNADKVALDFTEYLAKSCAREGYTVVSGGAKGVDSIAEESALAENGYVISIMANGLKSRIKEKSVREAILRKRLLILSHVTPDGLTSNMASARVAKMTFVANAMERNKYIYAQSKFAVVVSSDEGSGGTWAGAIENLKKGWVPLFVRIDSSVPKGNNVLVEEKNAIPLFQDKFYKSDRPVEECIVNRAISEILVEEQDLFVSHSSTSAPENLDVFEAIYPVLVTALEETQDINKLSKILEVNEAMLKKWVKRVDEAYLNRTVREKRKLYVQTEINFDGNTVPKTKPIELIAPKDVKNVYSLILPYLIKALKRPMNQEELRELLSVNRPQLSDWINRALEDRVIKKLDRPVRYVCI